jgi:hypothetical protein
MQPAQDWLPISIPHTYLMVAPSEEGADGVILIAHLLLLHFTIPVHVLASFFGVVTLFPAASEKPDQPG